jgi:hypothetical protein
MSNDIFIYRIDPTDTIISVSDNWRIFAAGNDWGNPLRPEDVVGHKLWDFIQDPETQHLYQELFRRARAGMPSGAIPFRCDSPGERRYLELLIKALPDRQIEIISTVLRTEPRSPISLLDAGTSRSTDFVTICSMCKKIKVTPQQWTEIEEGLAHLRIFEADMMPKLTHGLCHSCYQVAMGELDDYRTPNKAIDSDKE